MPKKVHPKIRREKAAELLKKAKEEEAKRFKEIGELFAKTYLADKAKPVPLEGFKEKAAKILGKTTKKTPSPKDMMATAQDMVNEAEQEEAERKQLIGDKVIEMLNKMQDQEPGNGADPQELAGMKSAQMSELETVVEKIWQE